MNTNNELHKDKKALLSMRLEGMTYREIADHAGVSRQRIQQLLCPPREIRDRVVAIANGKCRRCGLRVGKAGHVHHNGDEFDTYNDIDSLVLLCISCHRKAHPPVLMTHNAVKLSLADPTLSGAEIGRILHISRQRANSVLRKYQRNKLCSNCYHHQDSLCACREPSEIVFTPNKCQDWSPKENKL